MHEINIHAMITPKPNTFCYSYTLFFVPLKQINTYIVTTSIMVEALIQLEAIDIGVGGLFPFWLDGTRGEIRNCSFPAAGKLLRSSPFLGRVT